MLEFLETAVFTRRIADLLTDSEYAALQGALIVSPDVAYSKDERDDLTASDKHILKRLVVEEFK